MENVTMILVALIMVSGIAWVFIKEAREKNEQRFKVMYHNLEHIIGVWPVTKTSKLKIDSYFEDIRKLRFGNVEKVTVLWNQYQIKYQGLSSEK
jgi:hypothetical protein